MAEELRQTVKAFSDQTGIASREVILLINKYQIEATRDSDGSVTYSVADMMQTVEQAASETRARNLEHDSELMRRLLPEMSRNIAESVRSELLTAVAIRDTKEARLVELLSSLKILLLESRATSSFLSRLASQINLATVAGMTAQLPTAGLKGSQTSLAGEPRQDAFVSAADVPDSGKPSSGGRTAAPSAQPVATKTSSKETTVQGSHTQAKSPAAAFSHVSASGRTYIDGVSADSEVFKALCFIPGDYRNKTGEEAIKKHVTALERIVEMTDSELKSLAEADKGAVSAVLTGYTADVSDAPKYSSFFGSLSLILSWVETKVERIPPLVLFLALHDKNPGAISAVDFLDVTGINA